MGELWRWNGHRTRSCSRAPEHDLAWQRHLQHPRALYRPTLAASEPSPEDARALVGQSVDLCQQLGRTET
jgi:hypothetical protein